MATQPAEGPSCVPARTHHPDLDDWSDASSRAALQLLVESVALMVGFDVATLSVVIDDDLVTVAYAGPEQHREAVLATDSVAILEPVVAAAESWGRFRFLRAEHHDGHLDGTWVRIETPVAGDDTDPQERWDPWDVLLALLTDAAGQVVGVLSLDGPLDGRRPDGVRRDLLERYAAHVEQALLSARDREEVGQRAARAQATHHLVRSTLAPEHQTPEELLEAALPLLVEGFAADAACVQLLDPAVAVPIHSRDGEPLRAPRSLRVIARALGPELVGPPRALVLRAGEPTRALAAHPGLDAHGQRLLQATSMGSALAVPVLRGTTYAGICVLSRAPGAGSWSPVDQQAALVVGGDLGTALAVAQVRQRERALLRELQEVDERRAQLIATLTHELRGPLTVVSGNLELLGMLGHPEPAATFEASIGRGVAKMRGVVDDLLRLAQADDRQRASLRTRVDLGALVRDVVGLYQATAGVAGVALEVGPGDPQAATTGDPVEVERLLDNVLTNALKYTDAGGRVVVSAERRGSEVALVVADDGIGISPEDQAGLFEPFVRSSDPAALRRPGTGLGLSIVAGIAQRHGGRVEVDSALGRGTTVTVVLPGCD